MKQSSKSVDFLKRLLFVEGIPLMFNWDGIEIVVKPRKKEYHETPIFVNGIYQRQLYGTELHDKWFNTERANSKYGRDWRYLLGLDIPGPTYPPYDILYDIFVGIPAESEGEKGYYTDLLLRRHGTIAAKEIPVIFVNELFVLFTDGTKLKIND